MKNLILSAITTVFVFTACNSDSEIAEEATATETKTIDTTTKTDKTKPVAVQLYACSMHPEMTGKIDETCTKCGMKLTVPVKNSATP